MISMILWSHIIIILDFAEYHKTKEFLIQPNGLSNIIHKLRNGVYVLGATVQLAFVITTSYVSNVNSIHLTSLALELIMKLN